MLSAIKNFTFALFILILLPITVSALEVRGVTLSPSGQGELLTISLSQQADHRVFLLENPPRLVMDLPVFEFRAGNVQGQFAGSRLISQLRHARFNDNTSRLVLDLQQTVGYQLEQGGVPNEIRIRLQGLMYAGARQTKFPIVSRQDIPKTQALKLPTSQARTPKNSNKPLIVIDAGHGGQDPGAIGGRKTREKEVTLRYAKALRDALLKTGKYRVQLTRETDKFILLRERFRIARRAKADLFLSLHADSAPNQKAQGLSIYTLSEDASDEEAAALASQENRADLLADVDLTHEDEEVAGILIDLARRETKNKSVKLAENLVDALRGKVVLLTNPHRFAGFAVLKAPDIPSALIEIGFLTHSEEEARILTSAYQAKMVSGVVGGIDKYFATHN